MTVCVKCHRPLKAPTPTGMGPVCSRRAQAQPVPAHERDLFGYDIDKAVHAALYRLQVEIKSMEATASMELRASYRVALERIRGVRP
jgi:hypothetical protein